MTVASHWLVSGMAPGGKCEIPSHTGGANMFDNNISNRPLNPSHRIPAGFFGVLALLASLLCLVIPDTPATEYWSPDELARRAEERMARGLPPKPVSLSGEAGREAIRQQLQAMMSKRKPLPGPELPYTDYGLAGMTQAAEFVALWQVDDPGSDDHGGVREAEDDPDIIQTDNTTEAVWVWTHYYELTGDGRFQENIERAWGYIMRHPAYNEEGPTGEYSYYRVYNCGWALYAESKYRHVFGDSGYFTYAGDCARYIMDNPLSLEDNNYWQPLLGIVQSWGAGNLYRYGVDTRNSNYTGAAAALGASVKSWAEANPGDRLGGQDWAVSGGMLLWGLIHSYFTDRADERVGWLESYAPYVATYVPPEQWHNAHNAWYLYAHHALYYVLGDQTYLDTYNLLLDILASQDTDNDGGIPTEETAPETADETWVTNYIFTFGFDGQLVHRYLVTAPGPLAGNPAWIRGFREDSAPATLVDWQVAGWDSYGASVALGDIDGDGVSEVVVGRGPGQDIAPLVQAFELGGAPVIAVNFKAYGAGGWGVNVACGDVDGDGIDEILTGPGPGPIYGPHVRGWNYDGSALTAIQGLNFLAYGTQRWGVNVACGRVDGDEIKEIVTSPGPGAVFGPHVRGWNYDGSMTSTIYGINFISYGTRKYGCRAVCGEIDGDGFEEIITTPGPGRVFGAHVRGWDYDNGTTGSGNTEPKANVSFLAYGTGVLYGARAACGDLDRDGYDEIFTLPGPGPTYPAHVRGFNVDAGPAVPDPRFNFFAYPGTEYPGGGNIGIAVTRVD